MLKGNNMKELIEKWTRGGILKGIDEDYKGILVQVLENQRLTNESSPFDASFKRVSIPLVREVFKRLSILNKLISIQPISQPSSFVHYIHDNKETIKQAIASTWRTRTIWSMNLVQDIAAGMRINNLSAEAEVISIMAQELLTEIERKVLNDIRNSADMTGTLLFTTPKEARIEILDFIQELKRRHHRPKANWMVVSQNMAQSLFPTTDYIGNLGLYLWSTWEDVSIYVDSLFPASKVLIGYRGEISFDAGYVYSPYTPIALTPVQLMLDTFEPRRYILHQSANQMLDNTYYAALNVTNFDND
jgi:hypothetical protein